MQKKWNISDRFSGCYIPNVIQLTYFCKIFVYNDSFYIFFERVRGHYIIKDPRLRGDDINHKVERVGRGRRSPVKPGMTFGYSGDEFTPSLIFYFMLGRL